MPKKTDISLRRRPTVAMPGRLKSDTAVLHRCERSDLLLAAAIERCDWRWMEARDYKGWNSKRHVRRWSRNDDGVRALLASGDELDIYWSTHGVEKTCWRIVMRERVDGFVQAIVFDSVGIRELRAAQESLILAKCAEQPRQSMSGSGGRARL